ncbi:MAG TPA: pilus assembly protein PilM [Candidatus Paceibacterota bacterium]|nr:pilus assembly protein PilM [Candidatus Paceibacterota bacterium]
MRHFFYNRNFPTPRFIALSSVGLDFSDRTLRFVELQASRKGLDLRRFGEEQIPEGLVKGRRIVDTERFSKFLIDVRKKHKLKYVRVSLPEEHVYSFTIAIAAVEPKEVRGAIELVLEDNIPIKAAEAVFDFAILKHDGSHLVVHVVAVLAAIVDSYYRTFEMAGLVPVSFELEAGAIARSVVPRDALTSYMVVDFGALRTGISIVAHGMPLYVATLEVGGAILTQMIAKEQSVPFEEAESMKRAYSIASPEENKQLFSSLINGLSTLKDEINRRYIYWHTKKDGEVEFPNIEAVLLCGGVANLKGLPDYLATNLKLPVRIANPWVNMFSFESRVPELPLEAAMSYATAIGLALGDYDYD